jgi:hypothetical protein
MQTPRIALRSFKGTTGRNRLLTLAVAVAVAGCVTVNVNFPESAVQKAADDFVGDLYKPTASTNQIDQDTKADADSEAAAVKSSVKRKHKKAPAAASGAPTTLHITFGMTAAFAQELNTHTPKADKIKEELRPLVPEIEKWKGKGAICETTDALLVLTHPDMAGAEAPAVAKLAKHVNELREQLYDEIASANNIQDRSHKVIRKTFATAFKEHSPAGTCFVD